MTAIFHLVKITVRSQESLDNIKKHDHKPQLQTPNNTSCPKIFRTVGVCPLVASTPFIGTEALEEGESKIPASLIKFIHCSFINTSSEKPMFIGFVLSGRAPTSIANRVWRSAMLCCGCVGCWGKSEKMDSPSGAVGVVDDDDCIGGAKADETED